MGGRGRERQMKRRRGSPSVSSLRFYSVTARCPLWQNRIMRREGRKYQRGEDEERKEGREKNECKRRKKRE